MFSIIIFIIKSKMDRAIQKSFGDQTVVWSFIFSRSSRILEYGYPNRNRRLEKNALGNFSSTQTVHRSSIYTLFVAK